MINLKYAASSLTKPLTAIINESIKQHNFPEQWKHGILIPIHKKGSTTAKKNFRLIANLSSSSRVLEKICNNQLLEYLLSQKLISENNHAYQPGKSTIKAMTELMVEWLKNIEEGKLQALVGTDLSACFDLIEIKLLLRKMSILGIED